MPITNPCLPCLLIAGNPRSKPSRLPHPGDLALLGTTVEIQVERDSDGETELHRFAGNGPNLYWSPKLRALLIFPRGPKPTKVETFPRLSVKEANKLFKAAGIEPSAKLFRRWAAREPLARSTLTLRDYALNPYGRPVHIVYRSDKWKNDRSTEDYIHKLGRNVRMATAPGKPPRAILISGGRLTVNERGLVY